MEKVKKVKLIKPEILKEYENRARSFIKNINKINKIMNQLMELKCSDTELRFDKFNSINNIFLEVSYSGHHVSGSYVHDYEVAPGYIKTLEYESNRKAEWIERTSSGFCSDIYLFKIYLNKIISEEREDEIIIGKRYHIDSTDRGNLQSPYAFRICPGLEWAMMYSISENLNNNKEMPGLEVKDNRIVNIYGTDVFKIIEDAWEKNDYRPNSGRTHFKGTFDLIISESKFVKLYLKFYGKLNGGTATIWFSRYSSHQIKFKPKGKPIEFRKIGYLQIENSEKINELKEK